MTSWRDMMIEGLGPVQRVAAVFHIGPPLALLPFPSFKVKVIERADGSFSASPNVAVRGPDGSPDWIGGLGSSVDEALEDALRWFLRNMGERQGLAESDFVWSDPVEF